jgi:hypothetical protein
MAENQRDLPQGTLDLLISRPWLWNHVMGGRFQNAFTRFPAPH